MRKSQIKLHSSYHGVLYRWLFSWRRRLIINFNDRLPKNEFNRLFGLPQQNTSLTPCYPHTPNCLFTILIFSLFSLYILPCIDTRFTSFIPRFFFSAYHSIRLSPLSSPWLLTTWSHSLWVRGQEIFHYWKIRGTTRGINPEPQSFQGVISLLEKNHYTQDWWITRWHRFTGSFTGF